MSGFWRVRTGAIPLDRPLMMGVLNTTPDSFSDGGRFDDADAAVAHGVALAAAGADIIDVGGESARPGAEPVDASTEMERTLPVIRRLVAAGHVVSIDTMKPDVARAALDAGAAIVNDVGGMSDPRMREVAAETSAGVVVMHMQGTPRTMQDNPSYEDVIVDIRTFLDDRTREMTEAGVDPAAIVIDPGIGFGKTMEHNLTLLNRLDAFGALGFPVMVGASRKRFLGTLTDRPEPADRDLASAVAAAVAVLHGARILRVHNVAVSLESVKVAWAIVREEGTPWGPVVAEGVAKG
ncbi:MAG: dihydropteroate synthase [Acidimicrobiia bacterium]